MRDILHLFRRAIERNKEKGWITVSFAEICEEACARLSNSLDLGVTVYQVFKTAIQRDPLWDQDAKDQVLGILRDKNRKFESQRTSLGDLFANVIGPLSLTSEQYQEQLERYFEIEEHPKPDDY